MPTIDLTTSEGIKQVYEGEFLPLKDVENWKGWLSAYVQLLEKVRTASLDELTSPSLQHELWESTAISGTGMCSIPMTDAIQSQELANWIASLRDRELPAPGSQRVAELNKIHDELLERVKPFTNRIPWLKIMRLLAAIFPRDISCLVDYERLRYLTKAMYADKLKRGQSSMVTMNALVHQKIDETIAPPSDGAESLATRSMFVWELYRVVAEDTEKEAGEIEGERPGESQLRFLPDERRLKGLTSISGYCNTALKVLDFVQNGATVEEAREFLKQEFPQLKDSSIRIRLSLIRHTLGLLKLDGNVLQPSSLGQSLLESEDPAVLIPRVLTRVVGFDLILFMLKEKSPRTRPELIGALQELYPRWTSQFTPSSLLAWSHALRMVEYDDQQHYILTDAGSEWAEQIQEKPKPIKVESSDPSTADVVDESDKPTDFAAPSLEDILKTFESIPYVFSPETIARLHVALHMHPYKHFVLLSGLSGTGKTRLAKLYAHAYHRVGLEDQNDFYLCVPVQPDWTDPTGLLGYVNPLQEEVTYVGTRFLDFLISAVSHPKVPHFLCLDEMNLARVEYYFAPFLSAMESADDIVVHQNSEPVDTIEPRLSWPKNLYIIGTVNMDETTYAFSDKVLDRAFTIEFWEVDLEDFRKRFVQANPGYPSGLLDFAMKVLTAVKNVLEPARQHFGYRTAEEVLAFLGTNQEQGTATLEQAVALDHALLMKVLPKIRGQDSPEFRDCLAKLQSYLTETGLTVSAGKITSMRRELELSGTTRFWK